jgi:predicted RNase H-like nuclease (RuvC/YqgF family)
MIYSIESDTSSQIDKVLQRLEEYDVKFAKQEKVNGELQRTIEELQRTNEGLQRTNENMQNTMAGLSTSVARVSYRSSFMTPALPAKPPFIANTNAQRSPSPRSA